MQLLHICEWGGEGEAMWGLALVLCPLRGAKCVSVLGS